MSAEVWDLAVVGAGPAGLAAAAAASAHGARVVVVDEQQQVGGQIFRRPAAGFTARPFRWPAAYPWGRGLVGTAESDRAGLDGTPPRVSWRLGTTALGVLHDDGPLRLLVSGPNRAGVHGARTIRARRLLVATGALDLPVPLPGWTLPGVVAAGAAQGLLKSQGMLVGSRPVLAGSHPLLLLVADQLRRAGADVREVAIARGLPGPRELAAALPAVPGNVASLTELAAAVARLVAAGVKISTRTLVTHAHGDGRVESVTLRAVDAGWRAVGPERRVAADALVLGFGFQPSAELAEQAGCATRWDSAAGGWVVTHDEDQRTSVPEVLVAGEPAGVRGAEQARAEGHLAGLVVARDLGAEVPGGELERARRAVRRATRFSDVVQRMFAPQRDGLLELVTHDTVVCRCEVITRGEVEATIDANPTMSSTSAVKLECRVGMGVCQGRYCESSVAGLVARRTGLPVEQVGGYVAQFPVKPERLGG